MRIFEALLRVVVTGAALMAAPAMAFDGTKSDGAMAAAPPLTKSIAPNATGETRWRSLVCSSQGEVNMFGNSRREYAASPLHYTFGRDAASAGQSNTTSGLNNFVTDITNNQVAGSGGGAQRG